MNETPDCTTLYYRQGSSDKVYQVAIEPTGDLFVVNFAYGRRGSTLKTGTKTQTPVSYEKARTVYEKLVKSKTAKGYTSGEDGTPYVGGDREARATGIACQLLNPIDEADLADYLTNPQFVAQEKFDGRRLLVKKADGKVCGINRQGLETGLPAAIAEAAEQLPGEFIIDGEAVGDTLHAFDLLELDLADLRSEPYWLRLGTLERLLTAHTDGPIRVVSTASTPTAKWKLLDRLRTENREGIVFKDSSAPYTPGRPASGGTQMKFKFHDTASCLVAGINDRRSVSLALKDGSRLVSCGNVAIPANHDIPNLGQVVETRYLYAIPGSNALFQPVYLGPRHDIPVDHCTLDQLRYKAA
jgi:bifunctional non-homologous end joining protein LigD